MVIAGRGRNTEAGGAVKKIFECVRCPEISKELYSEKAVFEGIFEHFAGQCCNQAPNSTTPTYAGTIVLPTILLMKIHETSTLTRADLGGPLFDYREYYSYHNPLAPPHYIPFNLYNPIPT